MPDAIEKVLTDAAGPMRVCDIHAAVEDLLSATVPISTVNCWLSKSVQGDHPRLVRLGHGRYRLIGSR